MKVDGYISKQVITRWLESYEFMANGDSDPDAPPSNSGPKNYDGVSGGRLNKIMLDQALKSLSPLKRSVIEAKYIEKLPLAITLRALEIGESVYRDRLEKGIDDMYRYLNGEKADLVRLPANQKKLLGKIFAKA
jgi:fimbrial chaperone protein